MPPKSYQKAKKDTAAAATLTPKPKPARAPRTPNPAKKPILKPPTVSQTVDKDNAHGPIPIEVTYKGESKQAKLVKGDYAHTVELNAPRPFALVKTMIMPSGEYEGMQAIILRPSKSFPFLQLPKEAQARVYTWYFAPGGVINGDIPLEAKRKRNKNVHAKSYSEGSEYRVALLAVNKEIHEAAVQVFYANTLRLESTTTLLDFLSQISNATRSRLSSIRIQSYVKTTSRNAMHFLAEAGNIQRLQIDSGVFSECDPKKAAKMFCSDATKFLEAVAATKGDKSAGVDVLVFGKQALIWKDDQKKARPWTNEQMEEFKRALKQEMMS